MRRFVMTSLGELQHRSNPRLASIGNRRGHACGFQEQAFADSECRYYHLSRLNARQDFSRHGEARHDYVCTRWRWSRDRLSLRSRHALKQVEYKLQLCASNERAVHTRPARHSLTSQYYSGEVGECPSRSKQSRSMPVTPRHRCAEFLAREFAQCLQLLVAAILSKEPFGHADCTEREGKQPVEKTICARGELERATANIHDYCSTSSQVEVS